MAKLTGPLFSIDASGKIADALVYFPWKGRKVVRQWLKPTNPRDVDQKIQRQILASMGKSLKVIETPKTGLVGGSKLYQMLVADAPPGLIWNAHMVKAALQDLADDTAFAAFSVGIFGSVPIADWRKFATTLGFDTLTGEQYATTISPELQLAMGAYAAYKQVLCSYTDIYSIQPSEWTTDMICDFACDYVTIK